MLFGKLGLVLGFAAPLALCGDVFTAFYLTPDSEIGSDQFDVNNSGCFSFQSGAFYVGFTAAGDVFDEATPGPFCLNAHTYAGCSGDPNGQQQFADVTTVSGDLGPNDLYSLEVGVQNAGSYSWTVGACNGT